MMIALQSTRFFERRRRPLAEGQMATMILMLLIFTSTLTFTSHAAATIDFDEVSLLANTADDEANRAQAGADDTKQALALKQPERLTVIAPKYLRPQSDYHVLVTLANSRVPATIDLQLIGARDSNREQVEAKSVLAQSGETQTIKFQVGDWPAAEYVLSVTAQAIDRSWNFTDEKQLIHQAKSFSGFIQTDKAIYKPGQSIQFRALFLTPTLTPLALSNGISVIIQDPRRNIIKQWDDLGNYRGLLTLEMPLTEDPMLGQYIIKVGARNQEFSKQFEVAEYVLPTFEVSLQLPSYATYNESDIVATVKAAYTYGKPVQGHVTLTVQPLVRFQQINTRPLQQAQFNARLEQDGTATFPIDIVRDLRLGQQTGDLFEREIELFALVEEDLTGRKYNGTQTMRIYANNVKIERLNAGESFKPGMVQLMQFKVAYQDDIPVEENGPEVELRYKFLGRLVKSIRLRPQKGLIEHEFQVPARVASIQSSDVQVVPSQLEIEAQYRQQVQYLEPMNAYESQSHQYLQIQLPQLRALQRISGKKSSPPSLNIEDTLKVRVQFTEALREATVTCQGFARGDIVWALSKQAVTATNSSGGGSAMEFEVKLDQRMAPEMRIICFYVREQNKELIADSLSVPIGGLSKNLIKLAPSRDEAKPGQEVEVGVFTKPNSLVGVLAIDQSVLLLKSGNDLNQRDIMQDIKSYGSSYDASSSQNQLEQQAALTMRNTESLFDASDVVVLSNNLIFNGESTRLGHSLNNPNILRYASAGPIGGSGNNKIALDSLLLDHQLEPPTYHLGQKDNKLEQIRIRSLFPETWLWQNGTADARGQVKFSAKIPDTITSWQLSAFSLNEAHGLALSSNKPPTSIRVFRPFFIKLNLPYALIRGETVNIQAIIFNYSKRPVSAKVTLDNRAGHFEFVDSAANNLEDEKRSSRSSESRLVRVPAEAGASVSFLITPTRLGHIDIRVLAQSDTMGDGLVKKLLVKAEGQTQYMNKAMLVQLNGNGPTTWRRNVTIEVPSNAVEGSQKVFVSAIGDILGAGLSNVDDLLRLPYGCGEQNMINLVPNLVILNYLQNTRRLREPQRQKALRNLELGYQRQLNYKRSDGSFSAFGQSDQNGSVWLTAYVLKTLQQARAHITVDARVIDEAAAFIGRLSQPDGSIQEVGMLHNKALASQVGSSIYLTAYAMIALLQKQLSQSELTRENLQTNSNEGGVNNARNLREVIERGLNFLERSLDEGAPSSYELAIVAYALQLASRQQAAERAYEKLWARAIELNDQVWWSAAPSGDSHRIPNEDPIESSSTSSANPNGEREFELATEAPLGSNMDSVAPPRRQAARLSATPPLKPVGVKSDQSAHLFIPESLSVEQTAWALLTATKRLDLERALPIVRWLVGQQNSRGGFASTQDTVLAIEALSSYAEASALQVQGNSNSTQPLSLDVEFIYPRGQQATGEPQQQQLRRTNLEQLVVRQANALVQQQARLPDNTSWVQLQVSGSGTAVLQVSWQYNLLVSAEKPAFYLNPLLDRRSNLNYLQLSICTFYKGQQVQSSNEEQQVSNMAVMEVELPSGYVADVEALSSLKRHKQIKRIDTEAGETRVLIYLERVTRDELCLTVPAHRSSRVSNNRPVPVSIYDYYDRKQAARIFYEPQQASSCDICDSDACNELCSSKPKRAGKLISLHDQRAHLQQQQQAKNNHSREIDVVPTRNGKLSALPGDFSLTSDAAAYLPLATAFSTLMRVIRMPPPPAAAAAA